MKAKNGKMGTTGPLPSINIISEGTVIEGEINSNGDIRIDGKLKGIVKSQAKVVVGSSGHVNGNVFCDSADVHGNVKGTIEVRDILFLKSTSKINGDINTSKLVIEAGASFNGNCKMGEQSEEIIHLNGNGAKKVKFQEGESQEEPKQAAAAN